MVECEGIVYLLGYSSVMSIVTNIVLSNKTKIAVGERREMGRNG